MKKIWEYLNGKKTVFGVVIRFVAYGLKGINLIDENVFNVLVGIGDSLMAVGVGHKLIKNL